MVAGHFVTLAAFFAQADPPTSSTIEITGVRLKAGAHLSANRLCGAIAARDPDCRDKPADPDAPIVESIRFHGAPGHGAGDSAGDHDWPPRGGKPVVVKG